MDHTAAAHALAAIGALLTALCALHDSTSRGGAATGTSVTCKHSLDARLLTDLLRACSSFLWPRLLIRLLSHCLLLGLLHLLLGLHLSFKRGVVRDDCFMVKAKITCDRPQDICPTRNTDDV